MKPTIETGNVSQQPECLRDMTISKPCIKCKTKVVMSVNVADVAKRAQGALIQDAFPYLTPAEREMFITGICGTCWDDMFSEPEDAQDNGDSLDSSPEAIEEEPTDAQREELDKLQRAAWEESQAMGREAAKTTCTYGDAIATTKCSACGVPMCSSCGFTLGESKLCNKCWELDPR